MTLSMLNRRSVLSTLFTGIATSSIPIFWNCVAKVATAAPTQLGHSAMSQLPKLPGEIQAATFSPDGARLILAVSVSGEAGVSILEFNGSSESSDKYLSLAELPEVMAVHSISWNPDNRDRIAISVWEHRPSEQQPYQSRIHILNPELRRLTGSHLVFATRAPIRRRIGSGLQVAWLSQNRLLGKMIRDPFLYEIQLSEMKQQKVYKLGRRDQAGTSAFWGLPVSLGNGRVGVPAIGRLINKEEPENLGTKVSCRHIFESGGKKLESQSSVIQLEKSGNCIFSKTMCFRWRVDPFNPGQQIVQLADKKIVAELPPKSPFAASDAIGTTRRALGLSLDGSRLAFDEVDFTERSIQENGPLIELPVRLVIAELGNVTRNY